MKIQQSAMHSLQRIYTLKNISVALSGWFALAISAQAAITASDDTNPSPSDAFWNAGGDPVDSYTLIKIGDTVVSGGGVTGSLTVNDGWSLTTGVASIGEGVGTYGSALVSGAGSTWTVLKDPNDANDDGEIVVGSNGKGLLTIEDFASVTANNIYISDSTTADGTVLVDSSATLAVNYTLEVGYEKTGALTVQDSAQVDAYSVLVGVESTANGTLTVTNDGTLNVGTEQDDVTYSESSSFNIGQSGTGAMNITDGGVVNSLNSNIGLNAGSNGTVTVGGAGSAASWNVDGNLTVGNVGTGTLTINSNGTVDVSGFTELSDDGGSGSLVFAGGGVLNTGTLAADPTDLSGTGVINTSGLEAVLNTVTFDAANTYSEALNDITINLTADGAGDLYDTNLDVDGSGSGDPVVVAFGSLGLGDESGSSNTATVTGPNITLDIAATTEVGFEGDATLLIEAGGEMNTNVLLIGEESTGTGLVTVTGTDSTLDVTNGVVVGNAGDAGLDILAGGSMTAGSITISNQAGSSGDVIVDGGSLDVANDLLVGNGAFGELAIENGGVVTVGGETEVINGVIFFDNAGNGVLNTGHLEVGSIDDIEGNGTINASGISGIITKATFDGDHANPQLYTEVLDTTYIDEDTNSSVPSSVNLNLTADGKGDLTGVNLEVRDGANVSFSRVDLGEDSGDNNTGLVTGAGSTLNVSEVYVGYEGTGALTIDQGGELDAGVRIEVGHLAGSTGTLDVLNGSYVESESLSVGTFGTGEMEVSGGSVYQGVINSFVGVGSYDGSGGTGSLTVDGAGTQFNSSRGFKIDATGLLTVSDGAVVNQTGSNSNFWVYDGGSVVLSNGTLNTTTLVLDTFGAITGTGTINTSGLNNVAGADRLTFDGTNQIQTTLLAPSGSAIDLNITADGNGSFWSMDRFDVINGANVSAKSISGFDISISGATTTASVSDFLISYSALNVNDGATVNATYLDIRSGYGLVTGAGTSLTAVTLDVSNAYADLVSYPTSVEFFVQDGATVTANTIILNSESDVKDEAEIEVFGSGTALVANNNMYVGQYGSPTDLSIKGGATVSAGGDIVIGTDAVVNVVVYGNNQLNSGTDGTGGIQNDGEVNLFAYASLAAGVYTPISTGSGTSVDLTGSGEYRAFGGTWDEGALTFTVAAALDGSSGLTNANLDGARAIFDGGDLLVSFADGADGEANFDVVEITDVASISGFSTVQVYGFTTDMVFGADEQVLLSFNIGEGYDSDYFEFWHRADGASEWTLLDPDAATYAEGWVNFAVDGFSDYALTVPEPSTYALILGLLAFASAATRRRA